MSIEDYINEKRIGFLLERTTRVAKLRFVKLFQELKVDITPEQWVMLDALEEKGPMTQKQLGGASYKNAATISRIIDNLVKKNMVSRTPGTEDKRKMIVSLTFWGREIVAKCNPHVVELREKSWDGLSDESYADFVKIMDKLFDNLSM